MIRRFLGALCATSACLALLGAAGCATHQTRPGAASAPGPAAAPGELTSVQLSKELVPGINLGNTMEAIPDETAWGQPVPTQALMDAYRAAGFRSVRIPLSWSQYADADGGNVRPEWMAHVKQVVDYARNAGLYVLINVHWDGGWMDHPTYEHQAQINARLSRLWAQIAGTFRDYDDHLLFAGTNEVGMAGTSGKPKPEWAEVQNGFNQVFVDTVRATGGRNATRHLVVQGYFTNIDNTVAFNTVPKDSVPNRLFMEVHYYDPFHFTLDGKSSVWQWGRLAADPSASETWADEPWADAQFELMKKHFVDKGVGVIVGEYGAYVKPRYPAMAAQRRYWAQYVTRSIVSHGLVPMWWDTGELIDRHTGTRRLPDVIDAIVEAARQ